MIKFIQLTTMLVLAFVVMMFTTTTNAEAGWRSKKSSSYSSYRHRHYSGYHPYRGYRYRPRYSGYNSYYGCTPYGGCTAGEAAAGVLIGLAMIGAIQASQQLGTVYAQPGYDANGSRICVGGPDRC